MSNSKIEQSPTTLSSLDSCDYSLPPIAKADEYDKTIFVLAWLQTPKSRDLAAHFKTSTARISSYKTSPSVQYLYDRERFALAESARINLSHVAAELWALQSEARLSKRYQAAVEALKALADILKPAEATQQQKGGVTVVFNSAPQSYVEHTELAEDENIISPAELIP